MPLIVGGLLILAALFFLIKRNFNKKENSSASTEQGSGVVKVKEPFMKSFDISSGPKIVPVYTGYDVEPSGNGKLYFRNGEIQGDGPPIRKYGKHVSEFEISKYPGENSADTIWVTYNPK